MYSTSMIWGNRKEWRNGKYSRDLSCSNEAGMKSNQWQFCAHPSLAPAARRWSWGSSIKKKSSENGLLLRCDNARWRHTVQYQICLAMGGCDVGPGLAGDENRRMIGNSETSDPHIPVKTFQ